MTERVAIVTGAGRGIGAATATRLARDGWQVVASDIDETTCRAVAVPLGALAHPCDVADEAAVAGLVGAARDRYGRLDAIVSNAGIGMHGPLASISLADWNRVLGVNLTAAMLLAREAERDLRARKGAMVLIGSTRAHMSEPDMLAYTASKGGLLALTHGLAMALAPDVRVNGISPGWIDTGKSGPLSDADHAQHPVGRVGVPEDVAAAVAFLLSGEAGFMTGAEIVLDGGMTRKMIYV